VIEGVLQIHQGLGTLQLQFFAYFVYVILIDRNEFQRVRHVGFVDFFDFLRHECHWDGQHVHETPSIL